MTRLAPLALLVSLLPGAAQAMPGGYLGASVDEGKGDPPIVRKVSPESPAAKAGLKKGDRVLRVNGVRVVDANDLIERLVQAYPGETCALEVRSGGETKTVKVTLTTWSAHHRARAKPGKRAPKLRPGKSIYLAGQPHDIGAPVVTWHQAGGFDGYALTCFFTPTRPLPLRPSAGCNVPRRYGLRKLPEGLAAVARQRGLRADLAAAHIDQFVVHYDVAWTSRNCFKVLHDLRGLSVHFMLDVDGTLYQSLDLVERARHAGYANGRSVGIEIAHPGPLDLSRGLAKRYTKQGGKVVFDLGRLAPGVRTKRFKVRPARQNPIQAMVQGRNYSMYDYTDAQYKTLIKLLAGLNRILPRIRLAVPRDAEGKIRTAVMPRAEVAKWSGLLGHYHVSKRKQDPGPAFDWERVLEGARKRRKKRRSRSWKQ